MSRESTSAQLEINMQHSCDTLEMKLLFYICFTHGISCFHECDGKGRVCVWNEEVK